MKNLYRYILIVLMGAAISLISCQKDSHELGALVTPANVNINYEIAGVDTDHPDGDGSGLVTFTATADNAITFSFDFGDGKNKEISADGNITHQFSINGTINYNVTAFAVGTGGITSSKTTQLEVYSSFADDEAVEFLTGGSSKTWYWAADQAAHTGLGPTSEDNGNLDYTWPSWWSIAPFDADKACMYDAEFLFTKTDNGLTFEQTSGMAFIPGTYADKIGVQGDICHGDDVATNLYGVKNVSFSPSSSKASTDGGYRGTSMSFSDGGFMCWWVGSSDYDIIEVSENILKVRIKEDDTYSWYHIFTNVKPEQK